MPDASETRRDEQLSLARSRMRATRPRRAPAPAAELPVARVIVDVPLAHLDRPFDYLVPEDIADAAQPGCRIRVRFAGRLVDAYILERAETSDHEGPLAPVNRVVSPIPVLTQETARLARLVADRYAGSMADVLRLAIPPRHAAAERGPTEPVDRQALPARVDDEWSHYPAGPGFLAALAAGEAPRVAWAALPGASHWRAALAQAALATVAGGRSAVIVVPDQHDVDRLDAVLSEVLGRGWHTSLTADLGPAERYRRFLACLAGEVRVVVGTRAAAFAPVPDVGLVVCWDDGDDLHEEPRAPYPHVREILTLRAHEAHAGAIIGGFATTAEALQLVTTGWARRVAPDRDVVRAHAPRVSVAGDDAELARDPQARTARLPSLAWQTARDGLARGPVLVHVPRAGYVPAVACDRCRTPARCPRCSGPLSLSGRQAVPSCAWCGAIAGHWRCPECGNTRLRARMIGAVRTAEELGRAFPGVPVITSTGERHDRQSAGSGTDHDADRGARRHRRDRVSSRPALVVATPGAEPVADGGYAAALLLDGWALLARADLRAGEEALRRWLNAVALVRPGSPVVVMAEPAVRPVQALIRWDPWWHAERELADRHRLRLPPAVRMAALDGTPSAVRDLLDLAELPVGAEVLGPVPMSDGRVRALVRVDRRTGPALALALRRAQGVRSARKSPDPVRVDIDPHPLG